MSDNFSPEAEDQVPEQKKSQQLLLLLLLLLVLLFVYLYFFTGLIKPRPGNPPAPPKPAGEGEVVKQPLPPRPEAGQGGAPEKGGAPATATTGPGAKPAAPAPGEKPASATTGKGAKGAAAPAGKEAKPAAAGKEAKPAAAGKEAKPAGKEAKPATAAAGKEAKPAQAPAKAQAQKQGPHPAEKGAAVPGEAKGKAAAAAGGKPAPGAQAKGAPKEAKGAPAAAKPAAKSAEARKGAKPAAEEAQGGKAKKTAVAAKRAAPYALEVEGDLAESEIAPLTAKLRQAGVTSIVKSKAQKGETMHRLFLADFADHNEAAEELERLKLAAPGAFMLKEKGRYAVYAGSYLREGKAAVEQDRLYDKGVKLVLRKATAPVPVVKVRAGSFADKAKAERAAESLKKRGVAVKVVKVSK